MDIGLAFSYITRDREWVKKVLIGGVISIIPIVGAFVLYGYAVRIVRNVLDNVPDPLPEWDDFGAYLTNGFLAFVGVFIWGAPLFILAFCLLIFGSINDAASILSLLGWCLVYPLLFLYMVVVPPILIGRFAMSGNFNSMLEFNEVIAQIRSVGVGPYAMLLVLAVAASIISSLGLIACVIGVLFTSAFANYALAHGAAQLYRIAQSGGTGGTPPPERPAF
ncbi:MAG: DUF4013 domain-containing protein [Chloroflexota bacterium]